MAERPRALWYDSDRDRTSCGFSERPEEAPCGAFVTAHGLVDGTYVALYACARHELHLVRNSDWHHAATPVCLDPRAVFTWDDLIGISFCYLPDEPAEESGSANGCVPVAVGTSTLPPSPSPERSTQP